MTTPRTLICLLCSILSIHSIAQSPFNYGKNKNIYFFSRNDVFKYQVHHIYTIAATPEDHSWVFFDIDFTVLPNQFLNKFSDARDDGSNPPSLDSLLLDTVNYVNAGFYSFLNNKIEQQGMNGMGALCYSEYTFHKGYSIAKEACKYQTSTSKKKIVYYPNGLVHYKTCCEVSDVESKAAPASDKYNDTTYYVYDNQKKVTGYKKHKRQSTITPIFSHLKRQHFETHLDVYINKIPFEQFIDQTIGYRPKLILFEIYSNAVLPFQYDSKTRKYIEMEDIHLE